MAGTPQDARPDRPELQAVTVPVIDIGPLRDPDLDPSDTIRSIADACESVGFFTPNRDDPDAPAPDRYEGYKLHWECPIDHPARQLCSVYGSNLWADHVPDMAETVLAYWDACDRLATHLLDAFAVSLGIDGPVFRAMFAAPVTNMTLLHYPPSEPTEGSYGIHPHKDTNVFTILHRWNVVSCLF